MLTNKSDIVNLKGYWFIQPSALSPRPECSTDFHSISAKLKQVTWFIFLSPLRISEYRGFKIDSMLIGKFKSDVANFPDFNVIVCLQTTLSFLWPRSLNEEQYAFLTL